MNTEYHSVSLVSTTSPGIPSVLKLGGAVQVVFVLLETLWVADETGRSWNK